MSKANVEQVKAESQGLRGPLVEDLASSDQAIMDVATSIRNGVFWEKLEDEPSLLREYGPICQDGVLERELTV